MRDFFGIMQNVLLEIDFYNSEEHQGTSLVPFLGFMLFLFGVVVVFVGFVKRSDAKRQWNLFYDDRDSKNLADKKYDKQAKVGLALIIIGFVMIIGSFFILPL